MDGLPEARARLLRAAKANADGDPDAALEATVVLAGLIDDAEDDEDSSERLLSFLLSCCDLRGGQEAALFLSPLGSTVLDTAPRLLALGAASPAAAAAAAQLAEALTAAATGSAAAAGGQTTAAASRAPAAPPSCSPRELLTVLLETLDVHAGPAFESGGPLAPLLLRLLALLPPLTASLQRRRLAVAMSCLTAVADAAAAAGRRLAAVVAAAEAAAASAVAGAAEQEPDEVDEAAAVAARAVAALAVPFVEFAEQLHMQVLATELPPLRPIVAELSPGSQPERDRLRLSAWLLALLGALAAAWPERRHTVAATAAAAAGARGGGGCFAGSGHSPWLGSGPLAPLLALLWCHIGAACGVEAGAAGGGRGSGCQSDVVEWSDVWSVASAAAAEEDEGLEVCSDPELPRCGAALLLWADCRAGARGGGGSSGCSGSSSGGQGSRQQAGPTALAPPADNRAALQVLLEAAAALLSAAAREGSALLLRRGLQLVTEGCVRLARTGSGKVGGASEGREVAAAVPAVEAGVEGRDDPWVTAARVAAGASVTAAGLYVALAAPPFEPYMDKRDGALAELGRRLAVAAGLQMAVAAGPGSAAAAAAEEESRARAHGALQALLNALPPAPRALTLRALAAEAGGPCPGVAALALQQLRREAAAEAAPGGDDDGCRGVFNGPWVLSVVLEQLLPLLAEAGGGGAPTADGAAAAEALAARADAAAAALAVLRFLALRNRRVLETADMELSSTAAARSAVLHTVHDLVVRPVYDKACGVLAGLEEEVRAEGPALAAAGKGDTPSAAIIPPTSATAPPPGGQPPGVADPRFAGNVAHVSGALADFTAMGRLVEAADCLRELLG